MLTPVRSQLRRMTAAQARAYLVSCHEVAHGSRDRMAALMGVSRRTVPRLIALYAPDLALAQGDNQHSASAS